MTLKNLVPSFGKKKVPVRYDHNPFSLLHEDMDKLFEDFFRGFEIEPFGGRLSSFRPDIEVSENDKEIKITAELPGMDEKDIDVSLSDNTLTISGEKKEEKESKGKDYYMKERTYGSFRRSIPIYAEIEPEKVDARFKKGVLTITLPKSEKEIEKKKKIAVKVE
ncbi:MAG TPA: Hsp20/alpha crystallin family protein [Nitrospirae bacterium]|nr:spore protein SP21 [bacterium BMS3Abin06]HDH12952.1 Hsp20/alpha crystallin family protein [Nitrospirota bacterium]HDZ00440.1 Hsp20/alpha crystallin family protein [Nitrospirota bacterium]